MLDWLILVYMAGDNSISSFVIPDINDMEKGAPTKSSNFRLYIQADKGEKKTEKEPWTGAVRCPIWYQEKVEEGKISTPDNEREYLSKIDSSKPEELKKFVQRGISKYPSKKIMLVLWSHGYGIDDSKSKATNYAESLFDSINYKGIKHPLTPHILALNNLFNSWKTPAKQLKGILEDEGTTMSTAAISNILKDMTENIIKKKFDIIAFDACNMSSLELAYQISDFCDIFIASENIVPPFGFPYSKILSHIENSPTGDITKESLTTNIANEYELFYKENYIWSHTYTLCCANLNFIDKITERINKLSISLIDVLLSDNRCVHVEEIKKIRNNVDSYGVNKTFIDLGHFSELIAKSVMIPEPVRTEASKVHELFFSRSADNLIICQVASKETNGRPNATGLTIFFPTFEAPKMIAGYSHLEFGLFYWDELLKQLFNIQPEFKILEKIIKTGRNVYLLDFEVTNTSELSFSPHKLYLEISNDEYFDSMISITPKKFTNVMYSYDKKEYKAETSLNVKFSNDAPKITYVFQLLMSDQSGHNIFQKISRRFYIDHR